MRRSSSNLVQFSKSSAFFDSRGFPPSPHTECSLSNRTSSSPSGGHSSSRNLGSPSYVVCSEPMAGAEFPDRSDSVPMETPIDAIPMRVLPDPVYRNTLGYRCQPAQQSQAHSVFSLDDDDDFLQPAAEREEDEEQRNLVATPTSPHEPSVRTPPHAATDELRRKKPWTGIARSPSQRSPYRGGVLSLFTPSPPSPPQRQMPHMGDDIPDTVDIKDMDEDAQVALALAASLQEAAPKPMCMQPPKQSPRKLPRAILAVARPFRSKSSRVSM